jgi:hypothetical protein
MASFAAGKNLIKTPPGHATAIKVAHHNASKLNMDV